MASFWLYIILRLNYIGILGPSLIYKFCLFDLICYPMRRPHSHCQSDKRCRQTDMLLLQWASYQLWIYLFLFLLLWWCIFYLFASRFPEAECAWIQSGPTWKNYLALQLSWEEPDEGIRWSTLSLIIIYIWQVLKILESFVFLTQLWLYFWELRKTAKTSIIKRFTTM